MVQYGAHAAVLAVLNSPLMENADCPQAIILDGACIQQVHWEPRVLASEPGKWVDGKCPGRRAGLRTRKERVSFSPYYGRIPKARRK